MRQPCLRRVRAALRAAGGFAPPAPSIAGDGDLTRLGGRDIHDHSNPVRCFTVSPTGCTAQPSSPNCRYFPFPHPGQGNRM